MIFEDASIESQEDLAAVADCQCEMVGVRLLKATPFHYFESDFLIWNV